MLKQRYGTRYTPIAYLPTALIAALTIALAVVDEKVTAVAAFGVALASFWETRYLLGQIVRTTEQKNYLDQQLIQSQKLASIGELSSGIAHEINNPLAIIGQEIEWVRHVLAAEDTESLKKIEDLTDSFQEISRQVDRCREITHKLLDFARKKEPLIQSVDINRLTEDMAKLVDREAIQKQIEIVRDYSKDLSLVRTDAPLLRQVVLNLMNNATYAIGQNGTITISTRNSGNNFIEIIVRDTGCGIPEDDLNKIFDPFFTTKPPGKGTGLGLSICHGIVARLQGRIAVTSEVGKGTVFTVKLPVDPAKGEI